MRKVHQHMTGPLYDVIGIGFGPANIALAAAFEERGEHGAVLFLERAEKSGWQPSMLLDGSDIQNNPLRDLVTPRNPRSKYSFINFLHQHGRLFDYMNLGVEYPLRKEYAQYIAWVAQHFNESVLYDRFVTGLAIDDLDQGPAFVLTTDAGEVFRSRSLVVAPGRTPLIPDPFQNLEGPRVFHLTQYLAALGELTRRQSPLERVCVVGGSQSAIEIVLDLATRFPELEVLNVQRGFGFALKDTSPFSDRVYFPEHVDYYFNASRASKCTIDAQLKRTNYSSADGDVIHRLYLMLYEHKLDQKERIKLLTNTRVNAVDLAGDKVLLDVEEIHRHERGRISADCVVLATGFRNLGSGPNDERVPPLLRPIVDRLRLDSDGVMEVGRDYRLYDACPDQRLPPIFLNGLCENTHGMGDAGSFSLLSLRSDVIARSLSCALTQSGSTTLSPARAY